MGRRRWPHPAAGGSPAPAPGEAPSPSEYNLLRRRCATACEAGEGSDVNCGGGAPRDQRRTANPSPIPRTKPPRLQYGVRQALSVAKRLRRRLYSRPPAEALGFRRIGRGVTRPLRLCRCVAGS